MELTQLVTILNLYGNNTLRVNNNIPNQGRKRCNTIFLICNATIESIILDFNDVNLPINLTGSPTLQLL